MSTTGINSNSHSGTNAAAGNTAEPQATTLTADQALQQIRALRASIPEVAALTVKERQLARDAVKRLPQDILQAQLDFIGKSAVIETAVGGGVGAVRQLASDDGEWMTVERELKALLADLTGGNLLRRQRLHALAGQAYAVGSSLARTPLHPELVSHVVEVRRLRKLTRRKKSPAGPSPQTDPGQPNAIM